MTIEINAVTREETAYDKWIHFTYQGEEFHVHLHWDKYDGYDIKFTDFTRTANWLNTPDWVVNWEENGYGNSLEYMLDSFTDEKLEAK